VASLAKALGLNGTPEIHGDLWRVGAASGDEGPVLTVNTGADNMWTYSTSAATCAMPGSAGGNAKAPDAKTPDAKTPDTGSQNGKSQDGKDDGCMARSDPQGKPPSSAAAEKLAQPVLNTLGLRGAAVDSTMVMGNARVVTAQPEVGGQPTFGWATSFQVTTGGVRSATGMLSPLAAGAEYPVINAKSAVKLLPGGAPTVPGKLCGTMHPLTPKGADMDPAAPVKGSPAGTDSHAAQSTGPDPMPCDPPRPSKPPTQQEVRGARFGLSTQTVAGKPELVPSWLFTVGAKGSKSTYQISQVAIDPKYIAPPPAQSPPRADPQDITTYRASGRTLTVYFWGGVCSDYSAVAHETGKQVTVSLLAADKKPGSVCVKLAKRLSEKVTLDKAVGDRQVVDGSNGQRVPQTKK
jgi:hypothetical protein